MYALTVFAEDLSKLQHSNGYKAKYSKPRRIRIERIDGEFKNKEAVDGVTVIFFAKAPKGEHIVVGW